MSEKIASITDTMNTEKQPDTVRARMLVNQYGVYFGASKCLYEKKYIDKPWIGEMKTNLLSIQAECSALLNLLVRKRIITDEEYLTQAIEEIRVLHDQLARMN